METTLFGTNLLVNSNAESGLTSWAATNVIVVAGGTSGSNMYSLASNASLTQSVTPAITIDSKQLMLRLNYKVDQSEVANAFVNLVVNYKSGKKNVYTIPLNGGFTNITNGLVGGGAAEFLLLQEYVEIPDGEEYSSLSVTITTATLTNPLYVDYIELKIELPNQNIAASLTNETVSIPTDSLGNNGNFTGASTTMSITKAGVDDSANWAVSAATSTGVVGTLSSKTYTVSSMSVDAGYVDLTATKAGYASITKRFNLAKAKQGGDGQPGQPGSAGIGVSSIVEQYYLSTSATAQSGGAWSNTVPAWADGKYMWTRSVITYTDNTTLTTNPVCVTGSTGSTGNGITSVDVEYYLSTSSTTQTGGTWSTTAPAWVDGNYMWSRTKTSYTSGSPVYSNPACITGAKGPTGAPGKGISSVTEYYLATSASSGVTTGTAGWTTTLQSLTATNKYLWSYEKITYTDATTSNTVPVIIGVYGDTGKGISSVTNYYLATASSSGVTTATAGWTTGVQNVTATNKYLWNYEVITYTDASTLSTVPCIIGSYGNTGDTGKGISSIVNYFLATSASSGVTTGTAGFTIATQNVTSTNKYLWNYEVITYTDSTTVTTTPCIIGSYGDTGAPGKGVSSVVTYYLATSASSGVTTGTTGFTSTIQSVTATNKYLWSYQVTTYSDSTTSSTTPVIIGVYGDTGTPGKGITKVDNYYLATASSSGVTTGTAGWTTAVQNVTATNKYLWNYEVITYTDNSTTTTAPVIIGAYGNTGDAGKGISSVTEYYLATSASSGVTTATTGWTTTVQGITATNKYLWNYEKITYTDTTTSTTTPVIIGVYGDTGPRGPEADEAILFGINSNFLDWTGVLPNGYSGQTGVAPTKVASDNSSGNAVQWVVAAGASTYMSKSVTNRGYEQYIEVEVTFKLTSGTIGGAGVLIRLEATADVDTYVKFVDYVPTPVLNQWYTITEVIKLPSATAPAGYTGYTIYPMGGWASFGTIDAKTIQFDSVKVRPATDGERYGFENGLLVNGWVATGSVEINGGKIKADSVTTREIYVASLSSLSANIGTVTSGIVKNVSGTNVIDMTAGTINFGSGKFTVNAAGDVSFAGSLNGATGTFSGDIRTTTDAYVGNNILIGDQAAYQTKGIKFMSNASIMASKWNTTDVQLRLDAYRIVAGYLAPDGISWALTTTTKDTIDMSSTFKVNIDTPNFTVNAPMALYEITNFYNDTVVNGWSFSQMGYLTFTPNGSGMNLYNSPIWGVSTLNFSNASAISFSPYGNILSPSGSSGNWNIANNDGTQMANFYFDPATAIKFNKDLAIANGSEIIVGTANSNNAGNRIVIYNSGDALVLQGGNNLDAYNSSNLVWKTSGGTSVGRIHTYGTSYGTTTMQFDVTDETGVLTGPVLELNNAGTNWVRVDGELQPASDNGRNLGGTSLRWKQLYAGTTTIATSDERVKQQISDIPDEWLDAWSEVNFIKYKFNDAVAEKGDEQARWHIGIIAQRIQEAFANHGLNALDLGILGYDEWLDKDGSTRSLYSIRPDECQFLEMALMRRELNLLKSSVA